MSSGLPEPKPLYSVYQAGDLSTICFRAVRNNPAQPSDFLSFADLGTRFDWWMAHRAVGTSLWEDWLTALALARRKGFPHVASVDLARADYRTPWARTGVKSHVTVWAPAALLLQAVVNLVDT